MSYLLQLIPTRAGYARENAALAGDGPPPRLDRMIVGGGTPLADPASATAANIGPVLATSVQSVRMVHSADAITGEAGFPEVGTYTITWAALLFDDGTPAAYGGLTAPFEKGDGWAYSLEWVLSRTGVGDLALTVNIVDVNALAENVAARALDSIERQTGGIVAAHVTPIGRAMHHVLRDGNPLMQLELFVPSQSLRAFEQMTATGLVAGDDSLDLANQTDTALDGDYVITGNGHTETVRVSKNLELGRRRLVGDLQYTYPAATISRTTWAVGTGEAVAAAGGVYYSKPLPLADNARTHRVIVRAQTAAGAPDVAMRANSGGGYVAGTLVNARPAADGSAGYSDYLFDVVCADNTGHLRVTTPVDTRVRSVVLASAEQMTRVVGAPILSLGGPGAVPGQPTIVNIYATSYLSGGSISGFLVSHAGQVHVVQAVNNSGSIALTFAGDVGDHQMLRASAIDMLGNYSDDRRIDVPLVSRAGWAVEQAVSGIGTMDVPAGVCVIEFAGAGSSGSQYRLSSSSRLGLTENSGSGVNEWSSVITSVSLTPGAPGEATTASIQGQPIIRFAGGAVGMPAAQSLKQHTLAGDAPVSIAYNVPPGGSLTIRW